MQRIRSKNEGEHMKVRQSMEYNLGSNIRNLRKSRFFTQEQVVAKMQLLGIDISRSTYSQIECGTYNIKVEELLALCEIFHCDVNAIFKDIQLERK